MAVLHSFICHLRGRTPKKLIISWLTYYKIGQCQFLTGKTNDAFDSFDRAAGMKNGKYMRGYPVAASLVTNRTAKAIEYAGFADEGYLYLDELKEYAEKGYSVDR